MYSMSSQGLLELSLYPCYTAKCLMIQVQMVCSNYVFHFLIYVIEYIYLLLLVLCMMIQVVHIMLANIVSLLVYGLV